jgi:hypothetical protein
LAVEERCEAWFQAVARGGLQSACQGARQRKYGHGGRHGVQFHLGAQRIHDDPSINVIAAKSVRMMEEARPSGKRKIEPFSQAGVSQINACAFFPRKRI